MELQLALALPTHSQLPPKNFDLNSSYFDHNEAATAAACLDPADTNFELSSAFHQTLPVHHWNNQPNDDDNNDKNPHCHTFYSINQNMEENVLVGWPPVKTRRKRVYGQKWGRRAAENCGGFSITGRGLMNSQYVKVKMEGVGITRKVDLSLHNSFAQLRATLMHMFGEKDLSRFRLTYQDMDGDWLLAEDVAWRNFIRTVQRIKLEKHNG